MSSVSADDLKRQTCSEKKKGRIERRRVSPITLKLADRHDNKERTGPYIVNNAWAGTYDDDVRLCIGHAANSLE